MKSMRILLTICALTLGAGLTATDVEAKRLGSGKSIGMQRDATPQSPVAPPARTADAPTASPAAGAAAQAPRKNSWLGPIAGLAAGLGLAALASHLGFGEGLANMMLIGLLVAGAVIAFRLLMRKRAAQPAMQYAGSGAGGGMTPMPMEPTPMPASSSASSAPASHATLPADFDADGFVRQAKVNFLRLQAANDAGNLDDLREFVSPEMFAELQMELRERGTTTQRTEVMELHAEVTGYAAESNRHIVSVRFRGLLREDDGAAPVDFNEIWHLTKPVDGNRGWVVAGIQQSA